MAVGRPADEHPSTGAGPTRNNSDSDNNNSINNNDDDGDEIRDGSKNDNHSNNKCL